MKFKWRIELEEFLIRALIPFITFIVGVIFTSIKLKHYLHPTPPSEDFYSWETTYLRESVMKYVGDPGTSASLSDVIFWGILTLVIPLLMYRYLKKNDY